MSMARTKAPVGRPPFQHDEVSAPLTRKLKANISPPVIKFDDHHRWAICILNEMPTKLVNHALQEINLLYPREDYWLANPESMVAKTLGPVAMDWQSSFLGNSVEEAFGFLQTLPEDINIDREFLAVLDNGIYNQKGWLLLYRLDDESVITCVPCLIEESGLVPRNPNFHEGRWQTCWESWQDRGVVMFNTDVRARIPQE